MQIRDTIFVGDVVTCFKKQRNMLLIQLIYVNNHVISVVKTPFNFFYSHDGYEKSDNYVMWFRGIVVLLLLYSARFIAIDDKFFKNLTSCTVRSNRSSRLSLCSLEVTQALKEVRPVDVKTFYKNISLLLFICCVSYDIHIFLCWWS